MEIPAEVKQTAHVTIVGTAEGEWRSLRERNGQRMYCNNGMETDGNSLRRVTDIVSDIENR